jgi:EAL domain-containing protein (putative c-di-GMP-specific phosphodiesterase class I)
MDHKKSQKEVPFLTDEEIVQVDTEETPAQFDPAVLVEQTLESGIKPLEMRFCPIIDRATLEPAGFRTFTYMNSITKGIIPPEIYSYAANTTDVGIRLSEWNVKNAIRAIKQFEKNKKRVKLITARCSTKVLEDVDPYSWLKEIIKKEGFTSTDKLCLEFPETLLFGDREKYKKALLDIGLLGVKTSVSGVGADNCPVTNLIDLPVTFAILDPSMTRLLNSRSKKEAAAALLNMLRSMKLEIIGDGVANDDQEKALARADSAGYIIAANYAGSTEKYPLRMKLSDALKVAAEAS